jgi:hemolysin activation/secretion protein
MRTPLRRVAVSTLLAGALWPACATAQDAPYVLPRRAGAPAAAAPAMVRLVRFRGNTAIASAELEKVAAPYTGRALGEADMEQLRIALTQRYIDAGYVNSGALLGPGALEGDVLTFDIVEGRVTAVRIAGMQGLRDRYLLDRLGASTGAFNMEALRERFTLLLSDPLFERLNARLMPGTAPGEAVLDIEAVRARPYRLAAFVNNYRPPSIGANALGLKATVRNLSGMGDALDASVQAGTSKDHGARASVAWSVPLDEATAMSLQWDHGASSVVEEPLRVLDIDSVLDSKEIGISHVWSESLGRKIAFGFLYGERRNSTTLAGAPFSFTPWEPDGTTRVRALRLWKEALWRTPAQVVALRSTLSFTQNNTQDIAGLPPGLGRQPPRHAVLWQGQGQYARQVLDNGAQFIVRTTLQWTGSTLVALERMAVGGSGTVRGYRENQLIRDRAAIVNLEFDYPLLRQEVKLSLVPFADAARAGNRGEGSDILSSLGLATRLRWKALAFDLSLARRLSHPDGPAANSRTLQDRGVQAQLSYQFF